MIGSTAVACGDDDERASAPAAADSDAATTADGGEASPTGDGYAAALARTLTADPDSPFSAAEAACVAEAMVEAVGGPGTFAEHGITAEDIERGDESLLSSAGFEPTDAMARDLGARFLDCDISMGELMAAGFDATGGGEVSRAFIGCVDEQFTAEALGSVFLAEGDAGEDLMVDAALGCAHLLDG